MRRLLLVVSMVITPSFVKSPATRVPPMSRECRTFPSACSMNDALDLMQDRATVQGQTVAEIAAAALWLLRLPRPVNRALAWFAKKDYDKAFADFSDFAFYQIKLKGAHLVAGFGRIVDLKPDQLLTDLAVGTALQLPHHEEAVLSIRQAAERDPERERRLFSITNAGFSPRQYFDWPLNQTSFM